MVLCSIVISLSGVIDAPNIGIPDNSLQETKTPFWIPILFGILTPLCFTTSGILTKHLTSDRINFNPSTISFSAYFIVNVIVIIFAIPYWMKYGFS